MAMQFTKLNVPYRLLEGTYDGDVYTLVDKISDESVDESTCIPKMSEVYVYPAENGYRKLKVGDGTTTLANLPWAGSADTQSGSSSNSNIDLSNVEQDINIVNNHNLVVSGNLTVEGSVGAIEASTINAETITITGSPSASEDVVTKGYLESVLLTGTW